MPSSGYTAISFTAGEQPTTAKWNLVGSNDASFNTGNGFNDNIIVNRHLATSGLQVRPAESNPYKFSAYRAAAATTGSGAFAILIFDTKLYDTGTNYSTSTGLFTAPVTGFYQFDATVGITGATIFAMSIYKNGTEFCRLSEITTSSGVNFQSGSKQMPLSAGDTIAIYTYGSPAASLNLTGGTACVSFSGVLLSAA